MKSKIANPKSKIISDSQSEALRILILEDSPIDAELMERELRKAGIIFTSKLVDTRDAFLEQLTDFSPDIVLSDYTMPQFNGMEALELVKEHFPSMPLIIVTGSINEETAVKCMKAGAVDYVIKDNLTRIGMAVKGALEKKRIQEGKEKAEDALRISAQQWRTTFDAMSEIVCLIDLEGRVVRCNKAMQDLLTRPFQEIIGRHCCELMHGVSMPIEDCPLVRMRETGSRESMVLEKGARWFEVCVDPVLDDDGGLVGAVHVLSDITEIKLAGEKEREHRKFLTNVLESLTYPFYVIDTKDYTLKMCNSASGGGGLSKETTCYELTHRTDKPCNTLEHPCPLEEVKRSKKPAVVEHIHYNEFGQRSYVEVHAYPIFDNDGNIALCIEYCLDITMRKQAEEALRKSEGKYKTLVEHLPYKIFLKDNNCFYLSCNDKYAQDIGISSNEITGKTDYDLFPNELSEKYREDDKIVLESGKTEDIEEKYMKDGQEFWVHTIKTPVKDDKDHIIGVLGIFRDITEIKQAEEEKKILRTQLQQAQKMEAMGTLAGGIAHDFNNILMAIIGYADMTRLAVPKESEASETLDQVLKAGHRAKDLVQQILAFSRRSQEEKKPTKVRLIVKEVLKLLRATLPTTIEIRQEITDPNDTIIADPIQIHQVLMNLCTNAHHAMGKKGGILEVGLRDVNLDSEAVAKYPDLTQGSYLMLWVSDTGHGMDQSTLDLIFDPYFTTKETGVGTGLGLSVVHGIIKNHGGEITVQSKPGKGSTFNILLPLVESDTKTLTEVFKPIPKGNERILFIDDEESLAYLGKRMLGHLGYDVVTRSSSIEALELFREKADEFDLVITDQTMPGMTGDILAKELMHIRSDIPIILYTGYSEHISESQAKAIGIMAFVMKPFVLREIAQTVRLVLDQRIEE